MNIKDCYQCEHCVIEYSMDSGDYQETEALCELCGEDIQDIKRCPIGGE